MAITDHDMATIRGVPLFGHLSDGILDRLLANAFPREYDKGQMLFLQGEPAECFYVVLDGWLKVFRETADGDEAVIGVFTAGETIAEAAAFLEIGYPVSGQAVERARLLPIRVGPFRQVVAENPKIAMNMLASMSRRLHHLVAEVEQLKTRSATARVVEFLLRRCSVKEGPAVIALPYDKTLISRRLGMQPESLSRILAKLRKIGVRTEQERVVISDVARLVEYGQGDSENQRMTAS